MKTIKKLLIPMILLLVFFYHEELNTYIITHFITRNQDETIYTLYDQARNTMQLGNFEIALTELDKLESQLAVSESPDTQEKRNLHRAIVCDKAAALKKLAMKELAMGNPRTYQEQISIANAELQRCFNLGQNLQP